MYRHYMGTGGQSRRISQPEKKPGTFQGKLLAPLPSAQELREAKSTPQASPPSPKSGLSGELGKLLGKLGSLSLETEDLLLIAVLYLMYRESGDKELLIMIGALLFI